MLLPSDPASTSHDIDNLASSHNLPCALAQYPYCHIQPVVWGEMDAFQHVNNVVYHRYAETSRLGYLSQVNAFTDDTVTMLAKGECTYLAPVSFPDTLLIGVRTKSLGNSSIVMEYCYYSTAQQQVVATAESVVVRMNKAVTGKANWTESERELILDYEREVGHELT